MSRFSKEQYKSGQHALTSMAAQRLLLSFDSIQDKALISLAIAIGLRREDLVNIKKRDYDHVNGTITYFEHKKKRTRTVYIPNEETIQTLNMHLSSCRKSEWLFPSPKVTGKYKNSHISSRQCYDILNEHLEKIGLEKRPFHSLRATCYKILKDCEWTPREAAEMLGDSLAVAEIHYGAPSTDEMRKLAKSKPMVFDKREKVIA